MPPASTRTATNQTENTEVETNLLQYTFFLYKKPFYKKPMATVAKKLRNYRATLLDPKKLFYCEQKIGYFSSNFVEKLLKKAKTFSP